MFFKEKIHISYLYTWYMIFIKIIIIIIIIYNYVNKKRCRHLVLARSVSGSQNLLHEFQTFIFRK